MRNIRKHEQKRKFRQKLVFVGVILAFLLSSFAVTSNLTMFQASILSTKHAKPFDGTVPPFKLIPDYSKLTASEQKLPYDSILNSKLITLPKYDPNLLKNPMNTANSALINEKLTYSVPYLGDYKFDGVENAGSHPAIDIKVPMKTPVYAIANGVVIKTANLSDGFGNHIVIAHENVPSMTDPSKKVMFYSCYAHLDQILVAEGDVVTKGQRIGLSGVSGDATGPHLHFQIDTDSATWHPYWPFTYKDMQDAGIQSFSDAVNLGLGRANAEKMTVNPMAYVQKYYDATSTSSVYAENTATPTVVASSETAVTPLVETPVEQTPQNVNIKFTAISPKDVYMWNEGVVFTVGVNGSFSGAASVSLTNPGLGMLDKNSLLSGDFKNGTANVSIVNPAPGTASLAIEYDGTRYTSSQFEISSKGFNPRERVLFTDQIRQNLQGNGVFVDVNMSSLNYRAIQYLKEKNIISGYADGTFQPDRVVSRAEALKLILGATNTPIKPLGPISFNDVKFNDWFASYVMTGFFDNIVQGYADNTFRPGNTVNKSEFLKMLLTAMKVDINPLVASAPYFDVQTSSWFAPYVAFAKDKNLVSVLGNNFNPADGMKRKDVAEVIYRVMVLKDTGADKY